MQWGVVTWKPEGIFIDTDQTKIILNIPVPFDYRFSSRVYFDNAMNMILRTTCGRTPFWIKQKEQNDFKPLAFIPGQAAMVSGYLCRYHAAQQCFTAIEDNQLWMLENPSNGWYKTAIPEGFVINDVAFDTAGRLFCAGGIQAASQVAIFYREYDQDSFRPLPLKVNYPTITKTMYKGGYEEFISIIGNSKPLVATAICSALEDDGSAFAYVLEQEQTFVRRFSNDLIRFIDKPEPGQVRIFTCRGKIWDYAKGKFHHRTIATPLLKAAGFSNRSFLITALAASKDQIICLVHINPAGITDFSIRYDSLALCRSLDNGKNFEQIASFPYAEDQEACDTFLVS